MGSTSGLDVNAVRGSPNRGALAYDLMYRDGTNSMGRPYRERRRVLESPLPWAESAMQATPLGRRPAMWISLITPGASGTPADADQEVGGEGSRDDDAGYPRGAKPDVGPGRGRVPGVRKSHENYRRHE
jgi:hypothetical protein